MTTSQNSHAFGTLSRRSFVGAAALGTAAVMAGGLQAITPEKAHADETGESYVYTSCPMCNQSVFCGLKGTIKDGKLVRVEGNEQHSKPKPCLKGLTSLQNLYDPNRLLYPLKRTNPKKGIGQDPAWQRISWDEALSTIAAKFNETKATYGAQAVVFNSGDPKEHLPLFQRVAALFGTPNVSWGGAQCAFAAAMSGILNYGTTATTMPTADTKVHLQWGSNIAWSLYPQPTAYKGMLDAKQAGCKYIVVDTRMTPTARQLADIYLQPRPGTDGALALAMANVIIEEDLIDHGFVENWTTGFDEYKAYVKEFTPEAAEKITWVPADDIRTAARMWAEGGTGTMWVSPHSTTHHTNGVQSTRAIMLLPALMGYWDRDGCRKVAPGVTGTDDATFRLASESKKLLDQRAGVDRWPVWSMMSTYFQNNGLLEYINDGIIHSGLFLGTNLMNFPQTNLVQEAISTLDFAVGVDIHLNSWTHDYMDMVLPTAVCWERVAPFQAQPTGIIGSQAAMAPAGEAREDWQFLLDLGCALGFQEECFNGDLKAAMQSYLDAGGSGATVDDIQAALPGVYKLPMAGEWKPKGYEAKGFGTPSGKVEFKSGVLEKFNFDGLPIYEEPHISPVATPDVYEKYPLILTTGNRVPWYVHSKYRHTPWLNQFMPEPIVNMSHADAEARGLVEGDAVRVFNQFGDIRFKVALTNMMHPGNVEILHGWEQSNSCLLIDRAYDPISGFPTFKDALCEIEKV